MTCKKGDGTSFEAEEEKGRKARVRHDYKELRARDVHG